MQDKAVLVIGAGAWGKKIVDTLTNEIGVSRLSILQKNPRDHAGLSERFPNATISSNLDEIEGPIDLAVVATPVATHFEILSELGERGLATLVEKPFCRTLEQARAITELYRSKGLALFVDNIYLYAETFRIFAATFAREFGKQPYTYTSRRWDFGSFPADANTLSHLIYHDLTILEVMIGLENLKPLAYHASVEHFAQLTLRDSMGSIFDLTASQISARKVRTIAVAEATRGLDWDDLDRETPLRLTKFDVGAKTQTPLELARVPKALHSPLGTILTHALGRTNESRDDSVDVALKVKAFIAEIER